MSWIKRIFLINKWYERNDKWSWTGALEGKPIVGFEVKQKLDARSIQIFRLLHKNVKFFIRGPSGYPAGGGLKEAKTGYLPKFDL